MKPTVRNRRAEISSRSATVLVCVLSFFVAAAVIVSAQNPAFTYQGRLNDGVVGANGAYDFTFSLWDSASSGTQVGSTLTKSNVTVNNGVFTVQLDFSPTAPFSSGAARFLEISVEKAGTPPFVKLTPRQEFLGTPYASNIMVGRNIGTNPGNLLSILSGSPAVGVTDVAGGDAVFSGGFGTGLGGGGNVRIQTAGANDLTGTSDNLLTDRMIFVSKGKALNLASPGFTSMMSIHLTGTHTAGGRIFYMIRATDGGSQIATEEGVIQYLATANSITCTVQTTDKLHLGTVNSGCTPGFFNPGSQPGVSIFDNVTFSSPAPIVIHEVYFRVENESGSSIRLEP